VIVVQIADSYIVAANKCGSSSLSSWGNLKHCYIQDVPKSSTFWKIPVFSIWRSSYDRMLSGLSQGIEMEAKKQYLTEIGLTDEQDPRGYSAYQLKHYDQQYLKDFRHRILAEWCHQPSFTESIPIRDHTTLWSDTKLFRHPMLDDIQWIHISQLKLIPAMLDRKFNIQVPGIPYSNVGVDSVFRIPVWRIEAEMVKNKEAYEMFMDRVLSDWSPKIENMLDINDL